MDDQKQKPDSAEPEVLKTFDMYHFFSRKDVLLAIGFIVVMLIVVLFKTMFAPQAA